MNQDAEVTRVMRCIMPAVKQYRHVPAPDLDFAHRELQKTVAEALAAPADAPVASSLPARDHTKPAEQQGLFQKFIVTRTDGSSAPGGKHHGCEHFVLDVDHDPHAKPALSAYAAAAEAVARALAASAPSGGVPELAPHTTGQALMMTMVGEGDASDGHWYSPRYVRALLDGTVATNPDGVGHLVTGRKVFEACLKFSAPSTPVAAEENKNA